MKSMFGMGFRSGFEAHRLGLDFGFGDVMPLLSTGVNIYGQVNQADIAEQNRQAQAAAAATAAANAQTAAANAAAAQAKNPTILGMNRDVAIMGGIGLIAVVGLIALLK